MNVLACYVFGAIFTIAGILFAMGLLHEHLKEWKAMTDEERAGVNAKPLCRNIGGMIVLCGILLLLNGFSETLREQYFTWCMIGWLVLSGLDVYYIGKSKRYTRQ